MVNHALPESLRTLLMPAHVFIGLGFGLLALAASLFHLGRPQYAFRAVLGFKTSWLSREIIAFGLFAGLASVYTLHTVMTSARPSWQSDLLGGLVLSVGLGAVFTSVMVYRDTKRVLWDSPMTDFKFFMTVAVLGTAIVVPVSLGTCLLYSSGHFQSVLQAVAVPLMKMMVALCFFKLLIEAGIFSHLHGRHMTPLKQSALLMIRPLQKHTWRRLGGILLPLLLLETYRYLTPAGIVGWATIIFMLAAAGEFMERYLFFRAVIALRMPR
jgi:formate dehydrogenase iron-sulfur subunit